MEKEEFLKKYFHYIKWTIVAVVFVILMFVYENPFSADSPKDTVGLVSNCFAVPGIILTSLGILSYLSFLGAYDGIAYTFTNFSLHSLIPGRQKEKPGTLYEYKKAKDEKGRRWIPQALQIGIVTLGISLILLIVYAFM